MLGSEAAPSTLSIVTAAMFPTAAEAQRLLNQGEHEKLLLRQAKRRAALTAMAIWARQPSVEVYCVVNGGEDRDLRYLTDIGVHLRDRRNDLAGKPAQQRQAAFALAAQQFQPPGIPRDSRLFLWTEPDKHYLSPDLLMRIATAGATADLTVVNRSQTLLTSLDTRQAEWETDSNHILNRHLQKPTFQVRKRLPDTQFDLLHGPRVFRGSAVEIPIVLQLDPTDLMEMYGVLNKPVFTAAAAGLTLHRVEIDAEYPPELVEIESVIDPSYRKRQNAGIVANIERWLDAGPMDRHAKKG